jgi:NAD(P)-dependent dehydrogenase (short-subunit alcohol dehydrogenase family)
MLKEYDLDGKVAVVTGAGRGIGKGIALTLAEAGANIVALARTTTEINALADEVRKMGKECLPIQTDVTKLEEVQRMVTETIAKFGKIDILVNNAGSNKASRPLIPLPDFKLPPNLNIPGFYEPWSLDEWREIMNMDLDTIFMCTAAVGMHMIKQKSGSIINIASSWAFSGSGSEMNVPYCTAKAAVVRFTESLAREWAKYNVTINAIGPGLVQTELVQKMIFDNEETKQRYLKRIPSRKFGTTRDVGLLAVYLASQASSWLTGQVIYINGGETIA